jgi:hypothetical protein
MKRTYIIYEYLIATTAFRVRGVLIVHPPKYVQSTLVHDARVTEPAVDVRLRFLVPLDYILQRVFDGASHGPPS